MDRNERLSEVFQSLETASPAERQDRQFAAALDILKSAVESGKEVDARLKGAGLSVEDIRSYADFTKIPPLSKKELIGLQEQGLGSLLTCPEGALSRIYMSPGPLFDPEGRDANYWGWDEAFFAAGFRNGDLVQMTFSYHLTPAGLMLEEPLRNLGCAVIPAGPGNTDTQIQLMTRLPVTGFVGMASFLKIIADKAEARGMDLKRDFSLKSGFVAAERLPETLRSELETRFDMTVRQGYGTADVGAIAYECREISGMHCSSRCLVEICEPGTGRPVSSGEIGEVVVTPLNTTYPLIRLATGDLSRMVEDPCPCGRTAGRLAGILGRTDMTVKVKGQFLYPHQISEVMAAFPHIAAWQVIVSNSTGRDDLTLRIRTDASIDHGNLVALFQSVLKLRPRVEVLDAEEELPPGAPPLVDRRTWDR
ncbi:MAG: phenylacetate--CoA ligase family protein [Desulfovibrionales bacterium]